MIVEDVKISQFRNIVSEEIKLSPQLTVICGMNGQGKTNLLESIWMLTGAKSFRSAKDAQLIMMGEEFCTIESNVQDNINKNIRIVINRELGKTIRKASINEVDYGRAAAIAGNVTAIVFEPNHLRLVKQGPHERRNFIDTALCQLYPNYITLLRKYSRLVSQKNALLKKYYQTQNASTLLEVFNESLANLGQEISQKRQDYINLIKGDIVEKYAEISKEKEKLSIEYSACFDVNEKPLFQTLKDSMQSEINAGYCLKGPHREDFIIKIDYKEAKLYASQGQQRSAVLALKLAEANAVIKITGEKPILLFDDVLSELDEHRQNFILNNITDKQTVVTACDISLFDKTNGKIFTVENGKIKV